MNHLLSVENAVDKAAVLQTNLERLDESLAYQHAPTKVSGVANTLKGPPTSGTFPLYDLWVDSLGGLWRCTAAGTPGTWVQVQAANVAAFPSSPATGYRVIRTDQALLEYYWDGAAWVQTFPSAAAAVQSVASVATAGFYKITGFITVTIAGVSFKVLTTDGNIENSTRIKDGNRQFYNPDTAKWHTLFVKGAANEEEIIAGAGEV